MAAQLGGRAAGSPEVALWQAGGLKKVCLRAKVGHFNLVRHFMPLSGQCL